MSHLGSSERFRESAGNGCFTESTDFANWMTQLFVSYFFRVCYTFWIVFRLAQACCVAIGVVAVPKLQHDDKSLQPYLLDGGTTLH